LALVWNLKIVHIKTLFSGVVESAWEVGVTRISSGPVMDRVTRLVAWFFRGGPDEANAYGMYVLCWIIPRVEH
jgi:hypothetical protein